MRITKAKKTESIHVRLPDKTKVMVQEQAALNNRTIQQEIEALVALGLHTRKFSMRDYV